MKKKTINIFVSLGVMVLCGFVAFEYIDHVSTLGLGAPLVRTLKVFWSCLSCYAVHRSYTIAWRSTMSLLSSSF